MRVLHVSAGSLKDFGGIDTLLVTLARYVDACTTMAPSFALCYEGRLSAELERHGADVHRIGEVRIGRYWSVSQAQRRLGRLLDELTPDIAVCHESWPHAVFARPIRERRIPLVFWAHGLHNRRDWLDTFARRVSPDLVLSNSRATFETVRSLFPRAISEVIYYPVAAVCGVDRKLTRRTIRTELETSESDIVIVQSSRLAPWKGHSLLLDALSRLKDLPGWIVWIAGGTDRPAERAYVDELQRATRESAISDRVKFVGARSDIPNLLVAADIHCQPNIGPEPFGIAFIEAMAAGLPLVTTAIGAATEIVDAGSGVLVPANDAEELARSLRELICDELLRSRLGSYGRTRARELCDPERQLKALAAALARCV